MVGSFNISNILFANFFTKVCVIGWCTFLFHSSFLSPSLWVRMNMIEILLTGLFKKILPNITVSILIFIGTRYKMT